MSGTAAVHVAFTSSGFCYDGGIVSYYISMMCVTFPQLFDGCLSVLCIFVNSQISLSMVYYFWFAQGIFNKLVQQYHDEEKACRIVTSDGFVARGMPSFEAQCLTFIMLNYIFIYIRLTVINRMSLKDQYSNPKVRIIIQYMIYFFARVCVTLTFLYLTGNDSARHILYGVIYGTVMTVVCQSVLYGYFYTSLPFLRCMRPFGYIFTPDEYGWVVAE